MPRDIFRLAYNVHMEAENSDTAEVMLYGEIVEDGPKWWKWSEEDKSAADFDKAIKDVLKAGAKKLLLRINSPGGVCTESVAMRSILANAGFEEINIRIEGMCASAATDIATLPGAHVAIAEGSEYMIHNPWCYALGNANELEHTIDRLRNIEKMSRGFYMKRTGQAEEQIKDWMDAETWFTADQAVEYGFADEVLEAEVKGETPAAACVTSRVMATMRNLYKAVPEQIAEKDTEPAAPTPTVSHEAPVAGASTEINQHEEEHDTMDIKDINVDQLRAENPALLEQIQQSAVAAERARQDEIDALTDPGYEELAAQAKANGTSPADFVKQLVQAKKAKGAGFMAARQQETAPAQNVPGGEPASNHKTEEQEIQDNAKAVAEYAKQYAGSGNETMF
ncbi:MAG: Clp protease ClpP [Clostridia bacterium]|nr:Clp protease ClpP [Clostridia bacterium]